MNNGLLMFTQALKFRMNQIEAELQTEESRNKIAYLQGNCAGFRSLITALNKSGYEGFTDIKASETTIFDFDEKEKEWRITTGKYETSIDWNVAALDVEEVMDRARKALNEKVNEKKDWLFYNSEKGRDLYWIKGWYLIMQTFDKWCAKIRDAYKIAKKDHDYSLNFDDDDDE